MKLLIAVTHLLGTGHLGRALALGRAFAEEGHEVTVVSGGRPAPHLDARGVHLLQLPAIASDGTNFSRLLDEKGQDVTDALRQERIDMLLQSLSHFAPDVVITELFPFGRRNLRQEFTSLLEAAQKAPQKPLVLGSVRDILAPPSKPERLRETLDRIDQFYDGILVHSDKNVTPLTDSYPLPQSHEDKLFYTGYVTNNRPEIHPEKLGWGEILVATGGGAVGDNVFTTAIQAAEARPDLRFRLLVGGGPDRAKRFSKRTKAHNIIIEPVRPDYRQMMCCAAASVSMCGYNTAMDILLSGVRSVIIPFDDGGEVEQSLRAGSLAKMDGIEAISSLDLDAQNLLRALDRVIETPTSARLSGLALDGSKQTVCIVSRMLREKAT